MPIVVVTTVKTTMLLLLVDRAKLSIDNLSTLLTTLVTQQYKIKESALSSTNRVTSRSITSVDVMILGDYLSRMTMKLWF
jgi:hypothetical protein